MPLDETFIAVCPEAIIGLDTHYQIRVFNPAAERLFGYSAAELLGQSLMRLVPERFIERIQSILIPQPPTEMVARLSGRYHEWAAVHRDGHELTLDVAVSLIDDDTCRILAFAHNITARKQVENQLRQLWHAIEQSPATIVITDPDGHIEYANPKFTATTGYTLAEALGKNPRILKSGHTTAAEYTELWNTITSGREWHGEFRNKKKSGELYWEWASISPILDAQGEIINYLAVKEDITARKAAEAALHDERDLISAVLDTAGALLAVLNRTGHILRYNRACERLTGYTLAEVQGRPFWEVFLPPENREFIKIAFEALTPDQLPNEAESEVMTKDGQRRLISWSNSGLFDETGAITHIIANGVDLTERRRTEEALRQSLVSNRVLLNAIPDLMFRISRDGIYLDYKASDQIELYLPPNEFLGKRMSDVMPGEFSRQAMRGIEIVLGEGRGRSLPFEYQLPIGGQIRYYEARITASGPDEVLVLIREITDRKRAADAESEQRALAEALRDTAAALNSSLNLDEVLDRILDNVGQVVPHDAANIMIIDNGQAKVTRARGYNKLGLHEWVLAIHVPTHELFSLDQLARFDTFVLVPDTRAEPDWFELPQTHWVRSYVGVPIRIQGRVVGILNLDSATPGFFNATHGERLKAFANQAAIAIENAQLVSDSRRQAERERLINQITNRIRSSMDIDEIIKTTVEELGRILKASRCLIRLGADANYMPVAFEFDQPGIEPLGQNSSTLLADTGERVLARQTLALDDTQRTSPPLYQLGIRAILATPIMVRNIVLGALIFHECLRPRRWLPDEIDLIETIAGQVGVALENARLYHETRRQLGELAILHSAAIATADSTSLDEALHKVAQAVHDALGDVSVAVMLIKPDTDDMIIRAGLGYADIELEDIQVKVGQGVTGWVAQTGQPALVPDVTTDFRYVQFAANIRSELCVPLRTGSRVVGVLNVESRQLDAFTERDLQLLTTLSHNLTIIVENIRLLEEVRAANGRLKELDRLKSQFLANMSHELRTPLNAIIGFSELISDGLAGPTTSEQIDYLNNISTSGRHLLELINDILDLSKIQAGRMKLERQRLAVTSLVAEVQAIIAPLTARKQQQFNLQLMPNLPLIEVDPLRVKQVLINLLGNSSKFTPDGGQVTLRVTRIESDLLLFSVSDTGRGIPPAAQATIFEEFRQAQDAADREEGTGLGLAIAQRLIELHGGRIWVESAGQPGLGSTFYFTLPTQPDHPAISSAERTTPTSALIIEDDPDFSELLALHLRQAGYQTRQCFSGQDARVALQEQVPDLITLDMQLPDVSGWTLLQEIKYDPTLRHAGILIISGQELAQVAAAPGSVEYLGKPILKHQLIAAIDRLKNRLPDRPLRILLVDDDPMLLELLVAILPPPAYEVVTAINGAYAADQLLRQSPDLVILDLLMPDMNGFDLLASLRRDPGTRNLPVIVLTAKTLSTAEQAELAQSAQCVISKTSLRRDRLLAEIHRLRQANLVS